LPTQEKSLSPSKQPSEKPTTQPSTEPTQLPTQEPSSSPSKSDSKRIIICPSADPSETPILNTTVGDVISTVDHLISALTNGTSIATLASDTTGGVIALSSIALSNTFDYTQTEVQGALQTLVEAIDVVDDLRIGAFDTLFEVLSEGSLLDSLVDVMARIAILKEDYVNFLDSRTEAVTDKFRYVRTSSMWGYSTNV
jgi:hypothetical protein